MWITTEYETAGRSHSREGIPCQDKVRTYRSGDVTVITLADGAGTARFSHLGAEAVLEQVSRDIGDNFEKYFLESDAAIVRHRLYGNIQAALEKTQSELHCERKDLSSTFLAAAVCGCSFFIAHLGDGVVGYLKDGEIRTASVPDNGEYANETVFTTSPSVLPRMRIIKGTDERIGGFVLMSDGTENALYNKRTGMLSQGIKRIMQMAVLCPGGAMRQLLHDSFQSVVLPTTQDDCSISLLVNSRAFPSYTALSMSEKEEILMIGPASRNRRRRVRQTEEILIAAAGGASADELARSVYVKPKHIKRKLDNLRSLGLLEKEQGVYSSVLNFAGREI